MVILFRDYLESIFMIVVGLAKGNLINLREDILLLLLDRKQVLMISWLLNRSWFSEVPARRLLVLLALACAVGIMRGFILVLVLSILELIIFLADRNRQVVGHHLLLKRGGYLFHDGVEHVGLLLMLDFLISSQKSIL
jgi:hypothetical protein